MTTNPTEFTPSGQLYALERRLSRAASDIESLAQCLELTDGDAQAVREHTALMAHHVLTIRQITGAIAEARRSLR